MKKLLSIVCLLSLICIIPACSSTTANEAKIKEATLLEEPDGSPINYKIIRIKNHEYISVIGGYHSGLTHSYNCPAPIHQPGY